MNIENDRLVRNADMSRVAWGSRGGKTVFFRFDSPKEQAPNRWEVAATGGAFKCSIT